MVSSANPPPPTTFWSYAIVTEMRLRLFLFSSEFSFLLPTPPGSSCSGLGQDFGSTFPPPYSELKPVIFVAVILSIAEPLHFSLQQSICLSVSFWTTEPNRTSFSSVIGLCGQGDRKEVFQKCLSIIFQRKQDNKLYIISSNAWPFLRKTLNKVQKIIVYLF